MISNDVSDLYIVCTLHNILPNLNNAQNALDSINGQPNELLIYFLFNQWQQLTLLTSKQHVRGKWSPLFCKVCLVDQCLFNAQKTGPIWPQNINLYSFHVKVLSKANRNMSKPEIFPSRNLSKRYDRPIQILVWSIFFPFEKESFFQLKSSK